MALKKKSHVIKDCTNGGRGGKAGLGAKELQKIKECRQAMLSINITTQGSLTCALLLPGMWGRYDTSGFGINTTQVIPSAALQKTNASKRSHVVSGRGRKTFTELSTLTC